MTDLRVTVKPGHSEEYKAAKLRKLLRAHPHVADVARADD